ncbi:sulfurtransferase complex subunit TusC [Pseudoalteromonas denitrificans]|jgi:tRNA 2-thiouridine synthesizing protein C|uniref:tRNA 2-thiouridine synthesizing protein C n=1 Tax=Pseudoalteromonas denitrificans DSM 6059 TaxID=1123010 RepID=A0A1I1SJD3_9GAMM|nr:sulfurtransferase complex subunit TusC [Pseudoalteromonas denitrificans]SFD46599.1 tRNA 2-thiouridine synthesizing protein C [Pseudoalteromonas denitrificans DSM 6059]
MKNILVIQNHSPFDGVKCREALDTALIFAAVDQNVSILFKGDAVFCLHPKQIPDIANLKDYFKTLKMLELYDVENIYACKHSLVERGLADTGLYLDCIILEKERMKSIMLEQDHLVNM